MPFTHTLLVFSLVAATFVAIPGLGGWAAASGSRS
jgi:hypothetical protein